jgi:hypothetical protein
MATALFVREGRAVPSVQLDVRVLPWTGRRLVESFGGFGKSVEAATADAFENFTRSSFHVLAAALHGMVDDQVTTETWDLGGVARTVTLGNLVSRGAPPPASVRSDWFKALEAAIRARGLATGTHWVRAYHGATPGSPPTIEVLLDNETCRELEEALARFAWPATEGFFSVRIFFILRGGLDVTEAIAHMIALGEKNDGEIYDDLVKRGFAPADADRLVAFVPLAFGRVLVATLPVTFPETAILVEGGSRREVRLADEPIFAEAAAHARKGALTRDQFGALALRSAEINALNKALNAGSKPEDLAFSPPVVTLQ